MSQETAISWTDVSWNPTHGCSIVSTECRDCYAQTLSLKYRQTLKPWTPENAVENVILKPHKLREPLSNAKEWRGLGAAAKRAGKTDGKLVFVNSMSDLFHEQIPDEYIRRVFAVMAEARRHTFQILTKRPERMRDLLRSWYSYPGQSPDDPLPNVWLGVSVGKHHFNGRVDILRDTPAVVRFISAEPLLGPLIPRVSGSFENPVAWWPDGKDIPCVPYDGIELTDIDWVIVGGESGNDYRPIDPEWVADLREACDQLDVAFFFKQDCGPRAGQRGRFSDPIRWPQEFPNVPREGHGG